MASAPELPLPLYLERSSSFCNSVKNDLDYFIGEVGYWLMTVNRTAKTAPQELHKNRQFPGSCSLELREFTTSKQNVLRKLQTSFERMEQKWSNDISEFKDWFLENIATYLSKVQLDLKVSGRYSNLVAGPSSLSEVDKMSFDPLPDSTSASGHNRNGYSQGVYPSCVSASTGDVSSIVFQEDMGSLPAVNLLSVNSKKESNRVGGPAQMKNGSTGPSESELSTGASIPDSGIGELGLGSERLISQGSNISNALSHPVSSASAPVPVIGSNDFLEDGNSFCSAISSPVNTSKVGKKEVLGRGQTKRGSSLSKGDIAITESHIEGPAVRSRFSDTTMCCASNPCGVIGPNDFQEDADSFFTASPHPSPLNTKKVGKRRKVSKSKVQKAISLTNEKDASADENPPANSEVSEINICSASVPPSAVVSNNNVLRQNAGAICTVNPDKMKELGTDDRCRTKRGAKAVQMIKDKSAPTDFCIEEVSARGKVSDTDASHASIQTSIVGTDDFQENVDSFPTATTPAVNSNKRGKETGDGENAMQLTKEEVPNVCDSGIEEHAVVLNVSDNPVSRAPVSPGRVDTKDFQENGVLPATASPLPPVKAITMGKKRTGGRGRARKVAMPVQLIREKRATCSRIADSGIEKPALRGSNAASPPRPVNTDEADKKSAGRRVQAKKGMMAVHLTEEKSATGSGIEKPGLRGIDSAVPSFKKRTCTRSQGKKGAGAVPLTKECATHCDTEKPDVRSNDAASPSPAINSCKNGKKKTGGRGQAKRGARVIPLTEEKSVSDCNGTDSAIEKPAVRGNNASRPPSNTKETGKKGPVGRAQVKKRTHNDRAPIADTINFRPTLKSQVSDMECTGAPCALVCHGDVSHSVFQENIDSFHAANTPPPPANTKRRGRKGAQVKNRSKPVQLSNNETATAMNIPTSDIVEPVLRGKMSDWQGLLTAVENAPCKPGLFEVKVWRAKNPAYIGHSGDLQQSVSQYREGKPSGEKHLDQFIQRNKDEISVRYETYPSLQSAKQQQKKKLKEFMEKHKKLPSYNYGL